MNDKVKEQLADLLAFVKAGAEKTTEFAVEQAPLVAREIVAWEFWSALGGVALCVAAIVVLVRIAKAPSDYRDEFVHVYLWAGVIIFSVVGLVAASAVIKSTVAPRLVIIDYIGRLAK